MTSSRAVLVAPNELEELEGPLIYLDGALQGAPNWQGEAIHILGTVAPDVHVASPRAKKWYGNFEAQFAWEQKYAERAAQNGILLYWFAAEKRHRCSHPYAASARFQLGVWAARHVPIVVGIEKGFPGGKHLRRMLTVMAPNIPLCRSLRQTCLVGAELCGTGQSDQPLGLVPFEHRLRGLR